jgi:hypothetical protein
MFSVEDAFRFLRRLKEGNLPIAVYIHANGFSQWISSARVASISEPTVTFEFERPESRFELTIGKCSIRYSESATIPEFALSRISQRDWPALTITSLHGWTFSVFEREQ